MASAQFTGNGVGGTEEVTMNLHFALQFPSDCPVLAAGGALSTGQAITIVLYSQLPNANRAGLAKRVEIGRTTLPRVNVEALATATKAGAGGEVGAVRLLTFAKPVTAPFYFEQVQQLVVHCFVGTTAPSDVGVCPFTMADVVTARGRTAKFPLNGGVLMRVSAVEATQHAADTIVLEFKGANLKSKKLFGSTDSKIQLRRVFGVAPQPTVSQQGVPKQQVPQATTHTVLFESALVPNNLNPNWTPTPPLRRDQLCGFDPAAKDLELEVLSVEALGTRSMGVIRTSFEELTREGQQFRLTKTKSDGEHFYGEVIIRKATITHVPTLTEYLQAGFEVNLAVAIDFTGSNGDPRTPKSLHHLTPVNGVQNQYIRSITSVGEVLMQYDTDKNVPVYGFGAILPQHVPRTAGNAGGGSASHFFHVNGDADPYVHDIAGVLQAYGRMLPQVNLSGPTNFAPTIRSVTAAARRQTGVYTILLIITDGEITDMDQTVDAIVEADDAPLSIIICGVGSACDFEKMNILDGDGVDLVAQSGRVSRRDLVQFVPFRDFQNAPRHELAAEVLRELPEQFHIWAKITKYQVPALRSRAGSLYSDGAQSFGAAPPPPSPPPAYGQNEHNLSFTGKASAPVPETRAETPPPYQQRTPPPHATADQQYQQPLRPLPPSPPPAQSTAGSDCCICLTEKARIALIPCGHMAYCQPCLAAQRAREPAASPKVCPICRKTSTGVLEVFA